MAVNKQINQELVTQKRETERLKQVDAFQEYNGST